ncbi:hypothetical protein ACLHDG_05695 [Sulfurovum sp. CS9]|uniref:hypothetical protein n=1 Tax=Sulfurovum sp. CS9 TaxID=3391146 RepID=UPI0039E99C83
MKKIITGTLLTFSLVTAGGDVSLDVEETVTAPVLTEESSGWEHKLSIYGWLPSLDGSLAYTIPGTPETPGEPGEPGTPGTPDETVSTKFIDKIDAIFMGSYEVRKEKWSFLVDGIYFKMSDSEEGSVSLPPVLNKDPIKVATEQELELVLVSLYAGYNTIKTENITLEIIAGTRYFYLGTDIKFAINDRDIGLSPSVDFYDALIGIKGDVNLSENWYVPYLFDIGAGHSDLTWQAEASLGYRFNWGDVLLTYRYIHYDGDGSGLINDIDLYGPKLGLVFHF